jgi:hypothetical protein
VTPDEQRVADEIARCEAVVAAHSGWTDGDGLASEYGYHNARATLLRKVTTEQAIRFLREEMLAALKSGGVGNGPAATVKTDRWLRLQELDYLNSRRIRAMNRRMRAVVVNTAGLAAINAAPGGA